MNPLRFNSELLTKPPTSGLNVETKLAHFAIVTYMVDPAALRPHVDERFDLVTIVVDGNEKALVSVVPFLDQDFHFVLCPWPKSRFGQTNYRAYVIDSKTGEHVAWFFGTSLASFSVVVPRFAWRLPWHRARIRFDVQYDQHRGRYEKYRMETTSNWAPAQLALDDSGIAPDKLIGFPDLESGLVLLTHPLRGYYHRQDGRLGSYSIWHDRLQTTSGRATMASFPLLQGLGLVDDGDLTAIHSVLIQPEAEFTIYLPPKVVRP